MAAAMKSLTIALLLSLALTAGATAVQASSDEQALVGVEQGATDEQGTIFTLHALRDSVIVLNKVDGVRDDGSVKLGREVKRRAMKKGQTITFSTMMTENLPSVCVTVEMGMGADLWCPAISGKDGSLLLTPAFRKW